MILSSPSQPDCHTDLFRTARDTATTVRISIRKSPHQPLQPRSDCTTTRPTVIRARTCLTWSSCRFNQDHTARVVVHKVH